MSAYIILTRTKTIDQKELDIYFAGVQDALKGQPVELLVAYGKHEVVEGDPVEGVVIAKFPDMNSATKWYHSDAYQRVAAHRHKGAIYQGVIVEGL
jgi:uncharacterized protein (DUF1330 family)